MLTLYFSPGTCALASHLALAHACADFELVRVDFAATEQRSDAYLKVNPKGRVPALATPDGILTETPALLMYIAQLYPAAGLAPLDDAFELAQMNAFNSYLCSTVHVAHAHRMRGSRWTDDPAAQEALRKSIPETMGKAFALIEHEYLKGPWVLGERFSTSDFYLMTLAQWLEKDGVDLTRLPRVLEHRERLLSSPLVAQAIAREAAG